MVVAVAVRVGDALGGEYAAQDRADDRDQDPADLATGQRPVVGGPPAFLAAGYRFGALDVEDLWVLLVGDHELEHRQVEVAFGLFEQPLLGKGTFLVTMSDDENLPM